MPVYEYVCLDCKHRFDVLRSIKEADDPIQCNECESSHTSSPTAMGAQLPTAATVVVPPAAADPALPAGIDKSRRTHSQFDLTDSFIFI
jgi:putative FmdB family regulatory protein